MPQQFSHLPPFKSIWQRIQTDVTHVPHEQITVAACSLQQCSFNFYSQTSLVSFVKNFVLECHAHPIVEQLLIACANTPKKIRITFDPNLNARGAFQRLNNSEPTTIKKACR